MAPATSPPSSLRRPAAWRASRKTPIHRYSKPSTMRICWSAGRATSLRRSSRVPSKTSGCTRASTAGDLKTMAKQSADRVNELVSSGTQADGTAGTPLFTYDPANDTNIAATIAIAPGFTPDALAAVAPGPPAQANGIPLALSQLSNPQNAADTVNGKSFS